MALSRAEYNKETLDNYIAVTVTTGILQNNPLQPQYRRNKADSLMARLISLETSSDDFSFQFTSIKKEIETLAMIDDAIQGLTPLFTTTMFDSLYCPEQSELCQQEMKLIEIMLSGYYTWSFPSYVAGTASLDTSIGNLQQKILKIQRFNHSLFNILNADANTIPPENKNEFIALKKRTLALCKKQVGHNLADETIENLHKLSNKLENDYRNIMTPAPVNVVSAADPSNDQFQSARETVIEIAPPAAEPEANVAKKPKARKFNIFADTSNSVKWTVALGIAIAIGTAIAAPILTGLIPGLVLSAAVIAGTILGATALILLVATCIFVGMKLKERAIQRSRLREDASVELTPLAANTTSIKQALSAAPNLATVTIQAAVDAKPAEEAPKLAAVVADASEEETAEKRMSPRR